MTTDKTPATLATAKHGGCVQLAAVPYDRARELIGDAYNAGTHGIGYSQQAMELHDAVITARPSAGGQGALVDTARRNIRQFISRASFSSSVDKQAALSCVDVLEAALAARQPVREELKGWKLVPVKITDEMENAARNQGYYELNDCGDSVFVDGSRDEQWAAMLSAAPLAPPAQVVDLGQFLPAVRMLVVSARTSGGTAGRDAHLCEALDRVEALLPKADSQAVGDGQPELPA